MMVFIVFVIFGIPGYSGAEPDRTVEKPPPPKIEFLTNPPNTISIPEKVRKSLGIRELAKAKLPTQSRPLVLSGSTALDPNRLMRIKMRFPTAEVVQIGRIQKYHDKESRELRSGDAVDKDQLLGIFYSVDVGNKKNDLIDALVQLKLDLDILNKAEPSPAIPLVLLLNMRRNVEGDHNAVARAENSLKTWNIPEEDIKKVHEEAEKIIKLNGRRDRKQEARLRLTEESLIALGEAVPEPVRRSLDPLKDKWFETREQLKKELTGFLTPEEMERYGDLVLNYADNNWRWGRVVVRAPIKGFIVERNVTAQEVIIDQTINLFQIAQVDRLLVTAYAPEEELPRLHELSDDQWRWTIRTIGSPLGIEGQIDDISYIIDPAQHNAVVKGHIPNDKFLLRGGQFVTATIQLPPSRDVVEIPSSCRCGRRQAGPGFRSDRKGQSRSVHPPACGHRAAVRQQRFRPQPVPGR